jgi:hypothetical protein
MKQSLALENRESNLKDIETLSLEKYVEEIASAAAEGILRCKTDRDIWSAVEVGFNTLLWNTKFLIPTDNFYPPSSIPNRIYSAVSGAFVYILTTTSAQYSK